MGTDELPAEISRPLRGSTGSFLSSGVPAGPDEVKTVLRAAASNAGRKDGGCGG